MLPRIVVTVLAMFASVLVMPAASADAVNAAPNAVSTSLAGVSCASATFCAAVGSREVGPSGGLTPVAMIWNGSSWRNTAVSLPKGWPLGSLDGVSCTSASYCVAVGLYGKANPGYPLAQTWNGRAWTATALPRLAGSYGLGDRVSCAAARLCVTTFAPEQLPASGQLFADTLTGTRWTVHTLRVPKGTTYADFAGVSCPSPAYCVLVADVYTSNRTSELFVTWNGRSFAAMKTVASFPAQFHGLSCALAKSCVAIGTWFTLPTDLGYFAVWNGSAWRGARVPQPKAMILLDPFGVSCVASARCVMVGDSRTVVNGHFPDRAVAESYNGKSWSRMSVPVPAGDVFTVFTAVSCVSAVRCVAVGWASRGPGSTAIAGIWNGKSWKVAQTGS